jgi:hypothetical protein
MASSFAQDEQNTISSSITTNLHSDNHTSMDTIITSTTSSESYPSYLDKKKQDLAEAEATVLRLRQEITVLEAAKEYQAQQSTTLLPLKPDNNAKRAGDDVSHETKRQKKEGVASRISSMTMMEIQNDESTSSHYGYHVSTPSATAHTSRRHVHSNCRSPPILDANMIAPWVE